MLLNHYSFHHAQKSQPLIRLIFSATAILLIGQATLGCKLRSGRSRQAEPDKIITASQAAAERATRQQPVAELAPAQVPTQAAGQVAGQAAGEAAGQTAGQAAGQVASGQVLVGAEGTDQYGYPLKYVDRAILRSLLHHRRYAELTRLFEEFQQKFEEHYQNEYWPIDAASAFDSAEPELKTALDNWIGESPNSFAPYLARGTHLIAVAYALRGGAYADKTHPTNFVYMREAMANALIDIDKALSLKPKSIAAFRAKIIALMTISATREMYQTMKQAIDSCRECFQIRVVYINALRPRWNALFDEKRSYEMMAQFARQSERLTNPKMRLLAGYIDYDKADLYRKAKDYRQALSTIERACALGEYWDFLVERANYRNKNNDRAGALADINRAVELRPGNPSIYFERAFLLQAGREWQAAAKDLLVGLRVAPTDTTARNILNTIVKGLIYDGWQHYKAGRRAEALAVYDLAAELAPGNADVRGRRATIILGSSSGGNNNANSNAASAVNANTSQAANTNVGQAANMNASQTANANPHQAANANPSQAPNANKTQPLPTESEIAALEARVREMPEDFRANQQLDYALSRYRRFERILELWKAYLAKKPDDGRAYLERSGTYFNMRQLKEANADAQEACRLGVSEGCYYVKKITEMMNK